MVYRPRRHHDGVRALKRFLIAILVLALAGGGYLAWQALRPAGLPAGIASGNGRIEAVEIDVAAKTAGRIAEIRVNEGDFVQVGQVLAVMNTDVLQAQRREAEAQLRRAQIAIETARSLVTQREAERATAQALLAQREAELDATRHRLDRSLELAPRGAAPQQRLDDDRAAFQGGQAAINAARAQIAGAEAAISAARSQVVGAESEVEAVRASIERIQVDIDDSTLRSPREGRVQYRVAQPGEVVQAGGRVLNLVDLGDVYMTFFLPTESAGRVRMGTEVRLVLDAVPHFVIPAAASFVADVAQFTPKTVETAEERQKLMFRIRARISPELLRRHIRDVKTGLPGMAYVRTDPGAAWPDSLQVRVPQ
ncbi:HlyD family secretion protein [Belnapia rosea]|uniref:HlyD family secretion protein n=1 Tax=Belnapia rosea TaxID=938405 RepID=UPI0008834578|nr:HlyD family efflux transporter periplasmic adaptor subunit [Belnapia rosea]SDB30681.1 HlyD family secretion protein [Belnapia rosea]